MNRSWVALCTLMVSVGCGAPQTRPQGAPPPVELRPPKAMRLDFQWRQRVTVSYGERSPRSFDAVLHKQGDRLSLVGLTPLNTVTFVVQQVGLEVSFDNRTGEPLPFDGRHILQDVQRVYFPWLEGPATAGIREGEAHGERVTERLEGVQVVERTFQRVDRPPVRVVYEGLRGPGQPPARVILKNERYDYRLIIETAAPDSPSG